MAAIIKAKSSKRQAQPAVYRFESFSSPGGGDESLSSNAAATIEAAQQQAAEIRQRAAEEGRLGAEQIIEQRINERMDAVLPIVRAAAAELADAKQAWLRRWEQSAVQLAVKIAERIVRREVARSPQIAIELVREALELTAGTQQMKIRLNPADFAELEGQVKRLAQEISRGTNAVIVPDECISRGGSRLETQHGVIDQQIETQLERIAAELVGADG